MRLPPSSRQQGYALLFVLVLSAGLFLLLGATLEVQTGWLRQNHRELLRVQAKAQQFHLSGPAPLAAAPATAAPVVR